VLLTWKTLLLMMIGLVIGIFVGVLPGLGGPNVGVSVLVLMPVLGLRPPFHMNEGSEKAFGKRLQHP
jgi:TctA family transporter